MHVSQSLTLFRDWRQKEAKQSTAYYCLLECSGLIVKQSGGYIALKYFNYWQYVYFNLLFVLKHTIKVTFKGVKANQLMAVHSVYLL